MPSTAWLYLPLLASDHVVGVVAVRPDDPGRFQDPVRRQLLETFAGQVAASLDRVRLAGASQRAQLETEAERLRTALLSSLSHDLRTPLAGIEGAASSLLDGGGSLGVETRRELAETIQEESRRMTRLVANLLNMVRLETGALQVQKEWQPLEEVIGVALIRLDERLAGRPVTTSLPPDLPLVPIDGLLIEQVLINLIENALKYTPAGTPIDISARADTRRGDGRGGRSGPGTSERRGGERSSTSSTGRATRAAAEPVSASPSAAASLPRMAGGSGRRIGRTAGRSFGSRCRSPVRLRPCGTTRPSAA